MYGIVNGLKYSGIPLCRIIHGSQLKHVQNFSCSLQILCEVRVRFAPSPTGAIHLGGLRTALYNYAFAKSHPGGKFLLRIEDTDQNRLVPGISEQIEDLLTWAQLVPDESPGKGGSSGPYTQSQRLDLYKNTSDTLLRNGDAYKCFCSDIRLKLMQKEQRKLRQTSMYDGNCKNLTDEKLEELEKQNVPYTIRLKLTKTEDFTDLVFGDISNNLEKIEGDPIILKSDGFPTYNFANVVDDHYMGITHVLRGQEMLISTPKHILIYKYLGWSPPKYAHLPLLAGTDGSKLSKRHGALDINEYRTEGYSSESILNCISYSGGAFQRRDEEFNSFSLKKLIERFDISSVKTVTTRLDLTLLRIFSRNSLLNQLADDELRKNILLECRQELKSKYGQGIDNITNEHIFKLLEWSELSIIHAKDLASEHHSYLWEDKPLNVPSITNSDEILKNLISFFNETEFDSGDLIKTCIEDIRQNYNVKKKQYYRFLRQALTNNPDGPPLSEICKLLGKERTIIKLKNVQLIE